jgi:hypothetical protein
MMAGLNKASKSRDGTPIRLLLPSSSSAAEEGPLPALPAPSLHGFLHQQIDRSGLNNTTGLADANAATNHTTISLCVWQLRGLRGVKNINPSSTSWLSRHITQHSTCLVSNVIAMLESMYGANIANVENWWGGLTLLTLILVQKRQLWLCKLWLWDKVLTLTLLTLLLNPANSANFDFILMT